MITAVLPLRKGSQRIQNKNTAPIHCFRYGLAEIKIRQLLRSEQFSTIVIDTDIEYAQEMADYVLADERPSGSNVIVRARPSHLATNDVTTDELIRYIIGLIETKVFLWTHATSPFFGKDQYKKFVDHFRNLAEPSDSLMTVTVLKEFLWNQKGPSNYDNSIIRWPATQTIEPLFVVNSAAFIVTLDVAKKRMDRIGENVEFHETNSLEGFDVDWPDQFEFVKSILNSGYKVV